MKSVTIELKINDEVYLVDDLAKYCFTHVGPKIYLIKNISEEKKQDEVSYITYKVNLENSKKYNRVDLIKKKDLENFKLNIIENIKFGNAILRKKALNKFPVKTKIKHPEEGKGYVAEIKIKHSIFKKDDPIETTLEYRVVFSNSSYYEIMSEKEIAKYLI